MIPKEVLRKIRRIEIITKRIVNEGLAGDYRSMFKGQGVEFAEVRDYMPGDDVRSIDWNVTARMGAPFIKLFTEERELTVMLLVDGSASLGFGSRGDLKSTVAAEIGALLAFSAIQNLDKAGLSIFTSATEKFISPAKGKNHVLRVIREILCFAPEGQGTDLAKALRHFQARHRKRAVLFILSDFLDLSERDVHAMKLAAIKHDTIAVRIEDPLERELPSAGLIEFQDLETGKILLVDTSRSVFRERYTRAREKERNATESVLKAAGVSLIDVRTDEPYAPPLLQFFKARTKGRHAA